MLLTLLGVWNDQFTDGSCKHSLWIAKPQAAADAQAPPAAPELKLELSKRIAARLAKWKWLNYSEASDETELGFLNLSLATAGYLPRGTVDDGSSKLYSYSLNLPWDLLHMICIRKMDSIS